MAPELALGVGEWGGVNRGMGGGRATVILGTQDGQLCTSVLLTWAGYCLLLAATPLQLHCSSVLKKMHISKLPADNLQRNIVYNNSRVV